jgi:hypothetical protein
MLAFGLIVGPSKNQFGFGSSNHSNSHSSWAGLRAHAESGGFWTAYYSLAICRIIRSNSRFAVAISGLKRSVPDV